MLPSKALSPRYAELHCRSNFSFLTGASHPKELVARALQLGYGALAITDECSLSGVVHAFEEAQRCGLHLIVGATMWVGAAEGTADADPPTMSALLWTQRTKVSTDFVLSPISSAVRSENIYLLPSLPIRRFDLALP